MPEVVGAFLSTELARHERANCSVETPNSPRGNLAQQCFEFAVRQLDGIEVGRVLRQVANCRARFLNCLPDAWDLVGSEVIHHHDVVAVERRNQALLDIGQEYLSAHGPFDHHWCGHFIVPQGRHEGDRPPFSKRDMADQPDAARSPSPEPHHVGADRSLVDKHQPSGVKHALLSDPTSARSGHICSLPFHGLQTFFLRVMPCRSRKRQSELRLVRIRRRRNSATVSTKVRSGCSAIRANTCAVNSSSGETLPPRGFGAALLLSCQRCSHLTDELALISKRSPASRRDAPISTAPITRSRRSLEYGFGIVHLRKGESMRKDSLILNPLGIPPIHIGREPL